jgi:hypothetical protein
MSEVKQQAIINAYGQYWEQLKEHIDDDENGWIKIGWGKYADYELECFLDELKIPLSVKDFDCNCTNDFDEGICSARLKSLAGIENNNCWISIKENGLPKEKGNYWLFETNKEIRLGMFWKGIFDCEYPIEATHYQLIQKPLQPLY